MNSKPPIGVKPAWLTAWSRIGELVSAIERQYESGNGSTKLVEKWANEITWQCTLIEAMRDPEEPEDAQKRFTPAEVDTALVIYGQSDRKFNIGETIRYSPSEVRKILEEYKEKDI